MAAEYEKQCAEQQQKARKLLESLQDMAPEIARQFGDRVDDPKQRSVEMLQQARAYLL